MEWMLLPLKRYAQFSGRSRRKEFWLWFLFVVIASILLSLLDSALGLGGRTQVIRQVAPGQFDYAAYSRGGVLTGLFALAILIPNLAVSVRRLHDVDRSGWFVLLPIVPYVLAFATLATGSFALGGVLMVAAFVCVILLLVWYCSRGTVGSNRFGPDPLGLDPVAAGRVFD